MKRVLSFLIILFSLYSQDTIIVCTQVVRNEFRKFERELIKEIVDLHNRKNERTFSIKFAETSDFPKLFSLLDDAAKQNHRDLVLSINKISITKERKLNYDFSVPYMINKYVVLRLNERTDIVEQNIFNTPLRAAITKNSLYEGLAKQLDKKKTLTYYYYKNNESCVDALKSGKVDIFISDYVDTWTYNLSVVKMLLKDYNDELGILFPKNSKLRKRLEKYISYYVKSPKFYDLIRKFFGKERMNYYKEGIHSGI